MRNIGRIVVMVSILGLVGSSCNRLPYKVLRGEMSVGLGTAVCSIDKSKVSVKLGEGKEIVIPIILTSNEAVKLSVSLRTPDFIAEGYIPYLGEPPLYVVVSRDAVSLLPNKNEGVEITIGRGKGLISNTEVWLSMKESGKPVNQELILRILISG